MSGISDGISRRRRDRGIGHVRTTSWSRNKSNNKSNKCTLHLEGGPPTSQTSQQLPYIRPCSIFRFPPSPHLEVKPAARPPTYLSRQVAAKAQRGQTGSPPTHLLAASGGKGAERSSRQAAHPRIRGPYTAGRGRCAVAGDERYGSATAIHVSTPRGPARVAGHERYGSATVLRGSARVAGHERYGSATVLRGSARVAGARQRQFHVSYPSRTSAGGAGAERAARV